MKFLGNDKGGVYVKENIQTSAKYLLFIKIVQDKKNAKANKNKQTQLLQII